MRSSALIQGWVAREGPVPRTQAGLSCAVPAFRTGGAVSRLSKEDLMRPLGEVVFRGLINQVSCRDAGETEGWTG